MTDKEAVHQKLKDALHACSVDAPDIPESEVQTSQRLSTRLECMLPLLLATLKCNMMRNLVAVCLGLALMQAAWLCWLRDFHSNWSLRLLALGWGLISLGTVVGVPSSVPFLDVKTKAGFHGQVAGKDGERNKAIRDAFKAWMSTIRQCPYASSGELCTVLPFLWNPRRGSCLQYTRVWVECEDKERLAVDWVFPPGGFNAERPVVVFLTGLAPSQHWTKVGSFIADAALHMTTKTDMTVAILVSRGTMDTKVREHLFHGARVTDLRDVLMMAEKALSQGLGTAKIPPIFAAGFSMGAVILANYCGKYGKDTRLQGAVTFSGIHDGAKNMDFKYSEEVWQTYIAANVKNSVLAGNAVSEAKKRGVDMNYVLSRRCRSITDLDIHFISKFNKYDGVLDYYRDLSVAAEEKWKKVTIPLLAVGARDDPITHCDSLCVQEFSKGNSNLLFLITEQGGHVGWPLGLTPWKRGFDFMNEGITVFIEAVLASKG